MGDDSTNFQTITKADNKKRGNVMFIVLGMAVISLFSAGAYYIGTKSNQTQQSQTADNNFSSVESEVISDWEKTDLMGAYAFEYPRGWHVASIWSSDYSNPITVAINPTPINTAPRGGPLSEITFTDKSGLVSPDIYFEDKLKSARVYFNSYEEEIIKTDCCDIHYFKGEINLYDGKGENEVYIFKILGRIENNINTHIIEFWGNPFSSKYSNELKHVVMSFEPLKKVGTTDLEKDSINDNNESPIIVDYPKPNDVISSPITVTGKAKGTWFFEGDFPVTLYYGIGEEFVTGIAKAKGDWMTEDYVPFEVKLAYPKPYANGGLLVLSKNNPSDIEGTQEDHEIKVKFE